MWSHRRKLPRQFYSLKCLDFESCSSNDSIDRTFWFSHNRRKSIWIKRVASIRPTKAFTNWWLDDLMLTISRKCQFELTASIAWPEKLKQLQSASLNISLSTLLAVIKQLKHLEKIDLYYCDPVSYWTWRNQFRWYCDYFSTNSFKSGGN